MGLLRTVVLARNLGIAAPTVRRVIRTGRASRSVQRVFEQYFGMPFPEAVELCRAFVYQDFRRLRVVLVPGHSARGEDAMEVL